jgi:hypothetical protein
MVTTSEPLAAPAGLQIMREDGNAIDAAVATAGTERFEGGLLNFGSSNGSERRVVSRR